MKGIFGWLNSYHSPDSAIVHTMYLEWTLNTRMKKKLTCWIKAVPKAVLWTVSFWGNTSDSEMKTVLSFMIQL